MIVFIQSKFKGSKFGDYGKDIIDGRRFNIIKTLSKSNINRKQTSALM